MNFTTIWLSISLLSALVWVGLLLFRGQFWRANQVLDPTPPTLDLQEWPSVCAIVPARNEAKVLPVSLRSLLQQTYPGPFKILLIDDQSTDQTGEIAQEIATDLDKNHQLQVIQTSPLPPGWSGKLWAMHQGIETILAESAPPTYFLLTDADIQHEANSLLSLVTKAEQEDQDMVSLMVRLRCQSIWEQLLIPAFVFFFQKLYPFLWVNQPQKQMAAAAGGCILVRRQTLSAIGGIQVIRDALIDDCALAAAIKQTPNAQPNRNIWLGLTSATQSLRSYDTLDSIWSMVARTAFTQLNYSTLLLIGTVVGMFLIYMVPPISIMLGLYLESISITVTGFITWVLMTLAYLPTIRLYQLSPIWAVSLPLIALLYNLMTLDSARQHWQGKGGAWKGRVYPAR
ncbi:glycosyltransferase [Acaryochloris sp. CCMEE 5410]|uniref:glycosyltransferase n=1 Tax=Acaryochloris sp. CCMEE 5410 TaxID=310037 RepID=UPI0002483DBF|nr:glycosyltransferase [Acaryochloris sp. CCMEE 5410]KAI9132507.1 glycosyltransferase [Acaryochloris sp. CCMEE 5410]